MTLLDQEEKKQGSKAKKIVLFLLILSIMLLVFAIVAMVALSGNQTKKLTLNINGADVNLSNDLIFIDENENKYISLKKISTLIGYSYYTGGYKEYSEDSTNTKCYMEKEDQIVQIEANSKKVYKTSPDSEIDFEEFNLKNKIVKENDLLYISLDDFPLALNVSYSFSENENKIKLKTLDNLFETYKALIEQKQDKQIVSISEEFDNQKALAYDMLVISNDKRKIWSCGF